MGKYEPLWRHLAKRKENACTLSFQEIREIAGVELDHSFLRYKKEAADYGWQVGKISMKKQTVEFYRSEKN